MNTLQQGIITLMKSGITGEKYALPEGFCIADAVTLLKKHHIVNLAYAGAVKCGLCEADPVMQQLFQVYCVNMLRSEAQLRDVQRVFAAFDENGIDYLPLKGSRIKALYPKPELRYMGDADILIRLEQYPEIEPLMQSLGFEWKKESDHELVWCSKNLLLELHKWVIPSYNKDFYAYFGDGWQQAVPEQGTRFAMRPEAEMIFLFTHFAKHYRDGGVGCRFVADLWLFRQAHPELDDGYICRELEKICLREFYENILRLIDAWFCGGPMDDKLEHITDYIFASGSWGAMNSRLLSLAVRDTNSSQGRGSRGKYLLRTVFPSADVLENKYTVLRGRHYLLPLVWLYRPFHKLLFDRRSLEKQKEHLELLTQENVEERKKMLNYVGLDYNF